MRKTRVEVPENLPRWADGWSIILAAGRATPTRVGHPWLFSGGIAHALPPTGQPPHSDAPIGLPCGVFDAQGRFLGLGYYNADSQIAVRMVGGALGRPPPRRLPALEHWLPAALQQAATVRGIMGFGDAATAWRMVNGEGDNLPGLIIDRMADGAVVLVSTAGARRWLDVVLRLLLKEHGCAWVVARVPHDCHPSEGLARGLIQMEGEVPEMVRVDHHGVVLTAEPRSGQKTGLYLDQWTNHLQVAALTKNKYVLDAFCHGGGFGLQAAKAGARRVLCVDASQSAVDLATAHAEDNGLQQVEVMRADAVHVLRDIADGILGPEEGRPDVVIIDPPKFATRASVVDDALAKYVHLNAVAIEALADDGMLVSCSCSGRISSRDFLRALAHAASRAGRILQVLGVYGAAADHLTAPAHDEGRYLKVAICRVRKPIAEMAGAESPTAEPTSWSPLDD